jgi:hypothetical protein
MIEKMKRRGQSLLNDSSSASIELVKVTVTELNAPAPLPGQPNQPTQASSTATKKETTERPSADGVDKKKKKKNKKKSKGIDAFLEDDEEAKAFAADL